MLRFSVYRSQVMPIIHWPRMRPSIASRRWFHSNGFCPDTVVAAVVDVAYACDSNAGEAAAVVHGTLNEAVPEQMVDPMRDSPDSIRSLRNRIKFRTLLLLIESFVPGGFSIAGSWSSDSNATWSLFCSSLAAAAAAAAFSLSGEMAFTTSTVSSAPLIYAIGEQQRKRSKQK